METTDYIFLRKNPIDTNRAPKETFPHQFNYKEAREVLAASVRNVDRSLQKLMDGGEIRTQWGTWWAVPKSKMYA